MAQESRPVKVNVIHGPNLGTLGKREPELYGSMTLEGVNRRLQELAEELNVALDIVQSNHEGALVDHLEAATGEADGFLVNPGGLTHTSVVLRDALLATGRPFVEVHVSNPQGREGFRHRSFLSDVAAGVVFGFGWQGYLVGLWGLVGRLQLPGE